jgi:flagellar biogenesis protein FliO
MRFLSRRLAGFRSLSVAATAIACLAPVALGQTVPYPTQLPPGSPAPATAKDDVVPAGYVTSPGAAPAPLEPLPQATPVPLSPPVPLGRPDDRYGAKLPLPGADKAPSGGARGGGGWPAVLASLGFVLGLFLVCVRLLRKGLPQTARLLPKEAVETLGRFPLPGRRQGQLLRVGNKVVLVSFSSGGADVLVEIDDPREVDRLAGLCAATDPQGATQSFRGIVEHFFREKPARDGAAGRDGVGARRATSAREDEVA